jgi:uncharacterized protein (DUF58 family)
MPTRPHLVTADERSALRDLELVTRRTVEGLRHGLHRSPFHGFSAEFSQYRHYRPGDDLKYVDWKAFGRTDRLYSRQFRETTNLGVLFVVDASRSMAFPEDRRSKFDCARAAAAVLGTLVIDQGDRAGMLALTGAGRDDVHYLPPRSGRHHLRLFQAALARLRPAGSAPIAAALDRAGTVLRRRGLVVVASDFYDDQSALVAIRRLARMGHDLVIVHVMSQDELSLPRGGVTEFVDLETAGTLVADPAALTREYRRAVDAFLTGVRRSVAREGLEYVRLVAEEPLELPLRRFLMARKDAGRR